MRVPGPEIEALTPGVLEAGAPHHGDLRDRVRPSAPRMTTVPSPMRTRARRRSAGRARGAGRARRAGDLRGGGGGRAHPASGSQLLSGRSARRHEEFLRPQWRVHRECRAHRERCARFRARLRARSRGLFAGDANGASSARPMRIWERRRWTRAHGRPISARLVRAPAIALWSAAHDNGAARSNRNSTTSSASRSWGSSLKFCLTRGRGRSLSRHGPTIGMGHGGGSGRAGGRGRQRAAPERTGARLRQDGGQRYKNRISWREGGSLTRRRAPGQRAASPRALLLRIDTLGLGGFRRLRRAAGLRHMRRLFEQDQAAGPRVLAIALLRAEALRLDDRLTRHRWRAAGSRDQPHRNRVGQAAAGRASTKRSITAVESLLTFCPRDRWRARSSPRSRSDRW